MLFWNGADVEGQGGLDIPIDGQIDLVLAVLLKLEVLDVQDQIDYRRGYIVADMDGNVALELGTDRIAVGVDDEDADGVVASLDL